MRVRLRFTKLGKVRFTSHRDVARIWERALRRADLPLAYTEGFSPRPKVHFGLALSTSHESFAEYLDVDLRTEGDVGDLPGLADRLSPLLPPGIDVTAAAVIPSTGGVSLQQAVTSCSWDLTVVDLTVDEALRATARLLAADTLPVSRERKGRIVEDDLRPLLLDLRVEGPAEGGVLLRAELGTQPRAVRPSELIAALGPPAGEGRVVRTSQWIAHPDGTRSEPLPADGGPGWADDAHPAPHPLPIGAGA